MTKPRILMGVDLGTSGLKAALFSERGELLGKAYRESRYVDSPTGGREQAPEEWWRNLCSASREAISGAGVAPSSIVGIGICGFHHCPVFLREDGTPARTTILLHDERLPKSRAELAGEGVLAKVESLSRSMVSAAHFPPIFHYVRLHDPAGLGSTRWMMMAKDYLRYRLTGEVGTEICDATGTHLVMPGEGRWSAELCGLLSVPMNLLPRIAAPTEIAGKLMGDAAEQSGLCAGTPVVFGGGDSHCALLGLGCANEGDVGLLLGTNSTLRAVFNGFASHPQLKLWAQSHVVPGLYTVSASSMAGASAAGWFARSFCADGSGSADGMAWAALEELAAGVAPGSDGVIFLPYIHGERSPFYDPDASGAFLGLKRWHGKEHLARAVLEGVALNIANCHGLIAECADARGVHLRPPRLGGGGSRIALWHQIIADCMGDCIEVMNVGEAGTLGAAMLAGVGVGVYASHAQAISAAVRKQSVIEPDSGRHRAYAELRGRFNGCYRRLRDE